jgi:uncharacterized protein YjiS (DUF1127 family)
MNRPAAFFAPVVHAVAGLAKGIGRIVVAIEHRRELARLSDLDDRMLADIGLMRTDLRDAYAEPLWREPTSILARRAAERDALADGQPSNSRLGTRPKSCAAHRPIDQAVTRHEMIDVRPKTRRTFAI